MAEGRTPVARNGLPHFCSAPTLFALMLMVEVVALVIVLVPEAEPRPWLPRLALASLYVQWLALLNAVVLCLLGESLKRVGTLPAAAIAWLASVLVTALASAVVARMDQALGTGLTVPAGLTARFVASNAAIAGLIAAALLRHFYVREQWRERVAAAARAQVEALQARIRPHFLFNSMNAIASLIRSRPREAEQAVLDLCDLFRAALGPQGSRGTLGEELELLERFLAIERLRLGERLAVELDIAADLPRDFAVPRLLLQPLVENAVIHGIQGRAEGGTLRLVARPLGEGVEVVVENPLPPAPAQPGHGMALDNVRSRIAWHFGEHAALVTMAAGDRYQVTLHLPGRMVE